MGRLLSILLLFLLPHAASATWHEARSDHFIIYSDDSAENIRDLAARLEQFDGALRMVMNVPATPASASSRVTIHVVDDLADIHRLSGAENVAGFMNTRASGNVAFVPRRGQTGKHDLNGQSVLLHEYTHHFMYQTWGSTIFPRWFSEGFAELFATARFEDDGSLLLGTSPTHRRWGILDSKILRARTMLKLNPGRLSQEQNATLYARGWLAVHYLMLDDERAGQLQAYMRAINGGTAADAASAVFGDPEEFDRALNNYVRRPKLPSLTIRKGLDPVAVAVRPLTAGEAAMRDVATRSARGSTPQQAKRIVSAARKAAAPFADDAGAQNALAQAEFDAGEYGAAEAAADRALRADPKSVHAMIYKGRAMQARLAAKSGATEAEWKEARRWYLAANRIDPEYAWPLILFHDSFDAAGEEATDNAKAGLLYAHALAPFDGGLRIRATRLLIGQKKLGEARTTIAPVAYSAEQGAVWRDWAMAVMTALEAQDAKEALAAMDRPPADPAAKATDRD